MMICPLVSTVIFSKTCDVSSCMWNQQGKCIHGKPINEQNTDPNELQNGVNRIKTFIVVGTFLEQKTNKSVEDLKYRDIPPVSEFINWARSKELDITYVDYENIVNEILNNL